MKLRKWILKKLKAVDEASYKSCMKELYECRTIVLEELKHLVAIDTSIKHNQYLLQIFIRDDVFWNSKVEALAKHIGLSVAQEIKRVAKEGRGNENFYQ